MPKILVMNEDLERFNEYVRGNTLRVYAFTKEANFVAKSASVFLDIPPVILLANYCTEDYFLEFNLKSEVGVIAYGALKLALAMGGAVNDGVIYLLQQYELVLKGRCS